MREDHSAESEPALTIGRYRIGKRIGSGGMGAVYRATDLERDRIVALKVLSPALAKQPAMMARFRAEAQLACKLRHKNIVALYEFGEARGVYFLVMEYVKGCDLHDYIERKGQIREEEARHFTIHAAKALIVAHDHGIVHRDIKPSNLLLTSVERRPIVKLTDFGLAMAHSDDDFRVTRAGSTVGTVDYISPEQARNSRAADIRSDIYSLGCTLFHMLAGRPPFCEGDLAERLLKHLEAHPPDLRSLNEKVSIGMNLVVERMLAKRPEERYQTPLELLEDLKKLPKMSILNSREVLEALAGVERQKSKRLGRLIKGPKKAAPRVVSVEPSYTEYESNSGRSDSPVRVGEGTLVEETKFRNDSDPEFSEKSDEGEAEPAEPRNWPLILAIACGVLLAAAAVVFLYLGWQSVREVRPRSLPPPVSQPHYLTPSAAHRTALTPSSPPDLSAAPKPSREEQQARREIRGQQPETRQRTFSEPDSSSLKNEEPAEPSPVLVVRRLAPAGREGMARSLSEAWNLAAARKSAIIEIRDNGPLYLPPLMARDIDLTIRGAKGYRPILAWNGEDSAREPRYLLTIINGKLSLRDVDIVAKTEDSKLAGLLSLPGSSLKADQCSFSLSGRAEYDRSLITFEGTDQSAVIPRCRLERCLLRGSQTRAIALKDAEGECLISDSLLAAQGRALIDLYGDKKTVPIRFQLRDSTLVADQAALRVRSANGKDSAPQIVWSGKGTLISHSGDGSDKSMVQYEDLLPPDHLDWHGENCCYVGWQRLFQSPKSSVAATDLSQWRALCDQGGDERVLHDSWPASVPPDWAQAPVSKFQTQPAATAKASTPDHAPPGCDVQGLGPVAEHGSLLAYSEGARSHLEPALDQPPEIPPQRDGLYTGENLDLTQTDLGDYLEQAQAQQRLAPRVVLRLTGSGRSPSQRVRVQNTHLVLYVEPSARGRLVIVPASKVQPALFDIEGGSCDIVGGSFSVAESDSSESPSSLFRVRGGRLRLTRCRLSGPPAHRAASLETLVKLERAAGARDAKTSRCVLTDSLFLSGRDCIQSGSSGVALRIFNCVLVAEASVLALMPGPLSGLALAAPFSLENSTFASRAAIFQIENPVSADAPVQPITISSTHNAFLSPLAGSKGPTLLLGKDPSLARTPFVWRGEDNGYDQRLPFYVAVNPEDADSQNLTTLEQWRRFLGPFSERSPVSLDLSGQAPFDFTLSSFRLLSLPIHTADPASSKPPGADFERLGLNNS
jgi:serine/threonine-protein kinase